jgi:hypothetical protein
MVALLAGAAQADPGYYVVTPYANEGVRTVDIRYWSTKATGQTEYIWPEIGFAWGLNSRWTTELFLSFIGSHRDAVVQSTLNWQNNIMLTQGEWPVDVAVHLQVIKDRSPWKQDALEYGLLFQTDLARTQLNANVVFERPVGGSSQAKPQFKYQWQVRHRWLPGMHVGLQGFGELGDWNDWAPSEQRSHRAGPAFFGTYRLDGKQNLNLQAAWLFGKTYTKQGHMFTLRAHYNF